jgi:predicted HTH domain antitoxin
MKVLHNGSRVALSIDMPEDVRNALEGRWGDLSRHLTENLALDGYRQGLLSLAQVRRLLGFATRWEAQEFLGSHGIPVFDFDPAELDREAALQELADSNRRSKRG